MAHSQESTKDSFSCKSHAFMRWICAFGAEHFPTARASRPPYYLAEAMVNHKKMVHPPNA